jgi:excisionase family DNA binding protein
MIVPDTGMATQPSSPNQSPPLRVQLESLTLSVHDGAKALGVGRDTFYRLVREGKIKTIRVGTKIRVPKKALEVYIDAALQEV